MERKKKTNIRWEHADVALEFLEDYDEDADESYEYASDSDYEPLEFDSDNESSYFEPDEKVADEEDVDGVFSEDYLTLLWNLAPRTQKKAKPEVFYSFEHKEGFEEALWERERGNYGPEVMVEAPQETNLVGVEHVAGADCKDERGYSGYNITVEEMKGCCNYQCLAYKGPNWTPEPDDQDFELESECFLTGIGDRFPSRDTYSPEAVPARHGWDQDHADTDNCWVILLIPFSSYQRTATTDFF
jgi:hypothetical protein